MGDNFTKEFVDSEVEFLNELEDERLKSINLDRNFMNLVVNSIRRPNELKSAWRIRFKGFIVTTNSGKTMWKLRSHAKSALLQHFMSMDNRDPVKYYLNELGSFNSDSSSEYKSFLKIILSQLEDIGIIQYIEVKHDI